MVKLAAMRFVSFAALTASLLGVACAQTAAQTTTQAPASACAGQIIRDAVGPVCVPRGARRVVTIEWTYTENLLALGLQPIAAAQIKEFGDWVKTPMPVAATVRELGTRGQVNLEVLAALKPDLIIDATDNNQREALSKIAPTLAFNPYPTGGKGYYQEMRDTLLLMGQATGRTAQARQVLSRLDARIASARRTLAASGRAGETYVLSQGFTSGKPVVRLFGPKSWGGEVLSQIGLRNAWTEKTDEYGFQALSLEGLTTLNTQNFFAIAQRSDDVFSASGNAALWNRLPFVRQKRAYGLPQNTWLFGGPYAAEHLIEQVVGAMTGK